MSDNRLFIAKRGSMDTLTIGVGTCTSKRVTTLSDDDALELAYWLMALARGGETRGFQAFSGERP